VPKDAPCDDQPATLVLDVPPLSGLVIRRAFPPEGDRPEGHAPAAPGMTS